MHCWIQNLLDIYMMFLGFIIITRKTIQYGSLKYTELLHVSTKSRGVEDTYIYFGSALSSPRAQCVSMETSSVRPNRGSKMRRPPPTKSHPAQCTVQHSKSCRRLCPLVWWADDSTVLQHWAGPWTHCCRVDRPLSVSWQTIARGALQPIQTKGHLREMHTKFDLLII